MTSKIKLGLFLAGLALGAAAPGASAAELQQLVQVCAACHGEKGDKPLLPEYPILAGQYQNYLAHVLKDYRSGARKNIVMNAQAANLSDGDIEALSAYFAAQQGPLYTPSVHAKPE